MKKDFPKIFNQKNFEKYLEGRCYVMYDDDITKVHSEFDSKKEIYKPLTIGELKTLLSDNNIPDDCTISIEYECGCHSKAEFAFYNKDKNEVIICE